MLEILALLCAFAPLAIAGDRTLQEQLSDQYLGKIVFLRHSFASASQEYDSKGKLKGRLEEGPWTYYGRFLVERIVLEKGKLQLDGSRVIYKFDEKGNYLIPVQDHDSVNIAIRVDHPITTMDEAVSLLGRVFAITEQEREEATPSYWRSCVVKQPGTEDVKSDKPEPKDDASGINKAAEEKVNGGEHKVTAPKLQFGPAPEFQPKKGISGLVGLNVIVDSTGHISRVKIGRSLGQGLDEEAIRTVKTWRFAPATDNGRPVAVAMYIQIDFRRYD